MCLFSVVFLAHVLMMLFLIFYILHLLPLLKFESLNYLFLYYMLGFISSLGLYFIRFHRYTLQALYINCFCLFSQLCFFIPGV